MRVFVGYQDIDSGAKVATEHVLKAFKKIDPHSEFIVYKQPPYQFAGALAFTKNFFWSVQDFVKGLNKIESPLDAIYSPYYLLYLAKLLSKHGRVPFYFHLHGDQAETKLPTQKTHFLDPRFLYTLFINKVITWLQRKTLQHAHQVFFVSQQAKTHFLKQYQISLPAKKTIIIPNGISLTKFFPITPKERRIKKKKLTKSARVFVLLYVGRIDHKKGILSLVQSLTWLQAPAPSQLVIIHPDIPDKYSQHYLNLLKNEASQTKVKVTFLKNPKSLIAYYQIADLVILPSYQEMMPLVMLEAFACGVPFIGSKAGNMPEILREIEPKLILQKISPQTIANCINWFLRLNRTQRQKIISLEQKMARRYTWESSAKKIIHQLTQSP